MIVVVLVAHLASQSAQCSCEDLQKRVEALEAQVKALQKAPPRAGLDRAEQGAAYELASGRSPVLGNARAPIALTIFADHQCPFSARVFPMLGEVIKDPELTKRVRVVYKFFPLSFHVHAKWAAKVSLAAHEQGRFWEMSEVLFQRQRELVPDNLAEFARLAGVDYARLIRDLEIKDADYERIIAADADLGVNKAYVRGTPSIFVGGWELRTRSVDGVKQLIADKKL